MGYHEGKPWSGLDRWECDDCPFDSLDEEKMKEHSRKYHGTNAPEEEVETGEEEE